MSKEEPINIDADKKIADQAREALKEFELSRHIKYNKIEAKKDSDQVSSQNPSFGGQGDFSEVGQALAQFESKQEEEEIVKNKIDQYPETSKMAKFLIIHSGGLLKNKNQANFTLLIIAILFFLASGILFFIATNKGGSDSPVEISPEVLRQYGN